MNDRSQDAGGSGRARASRRGRRNHPPARRGGRATTAPTSSDPPSTGPSSTVATSSRQGGRGSSRGSTGGVPRRDFPRRDQDGRVVGLVDLLALTLAGLLTTAAVLVLPDASGAA